MEIVMKRLNDITPYKDNPRINDGAIKFVANSIKEFGFKNPIVLDKDGVIICGHTRYEASKKLGLKEVPCVVADDLSEEQVKAYRLADNKTAEKASWDYDLLEMEIDGISLDMDLFGFDDMTNALEDLMEERVGKQAVDSHGDMFAMTFLFPIEAKGAVDAYVKKHTKERLSNEIVNLCEVDYAD